MFYAQFVLSKKGPLAKIWLAAHWEKKLSKAQIYETSVEDAVEEIIQPKSKMALRTTGHLLLGIVRIYSRQAKYLLADCNEAFLKIKLAFRPGQLDLPNDPMPMASITMPEVFTDYDTSLPDFNDADYNTNQQISQSRIDDITLKEDTLADSSNNYDNFGMDDFGEHAAGGVCMDDDFGDFGMDFGEETNSKGRDVREQTPMFDAAKPSGVSVFTDDDYFEAAGGDDDEEVIQDDNMSGIINIRSTANDDTQSVASFTHAMSMERETFPLETESFYDRHERRARKKRRLIVDECISLSNEEMKAHMADYNDILAPLDMAPPTRKLMRMKATGNVEKLFHLPGCTAMRAKPLVRMYQTFLTYNTPSDQNQMEQVTHDLHLGDLPDEEMQHLQNYVQDNDPGFADEFDDGGVADIDPMEPGTPPPMDLAAAELPQSPPKEHDDFSPTEKKKRRGAEARVAEEEEPGTDDDDHRWTKRTQNVLNSIATKIRASPGEEIGLTDLLNKGSTRKNAAQKFYTLLVLKKWQAIDIKQSAPYEEITITPGPNIAQNVAQ